MLRMTNGGKSAEERRSVGGVTAEERRRSDGRDVCKNLGGIFRKPVGTQFHQSDSVINLAFLEI